MAATIAPRELQQQALAGDSITLIDVRTPAEFEDTHVPFAKNIPLDELRPETHAASGTLYVICQKGGRASEACAKLEAAGVPAINVEGGTAGWEAAGLPVVKGQQAMSLERQVRIAAGAFVAIGTALGLISPWFLLIPGFVGCGLVFAGVTDTCGMGMLLARMPWNQRAAASETCSTATAA